MALAVANFECVVTVGISTKERYFVIRIIRQLDQQFQIRPVFYSVARRTNSEREYIFGASSHPTNVSWQCEGTYDNQDDYGKPHSIACFPHGIAAPGVPDRGEYLLFGLSTIRQKLSRFSPKCPLVSRADYHVGLGDFHFSDYGLSELTRTHERPTAFFGRRCEYKLCLTGDAHV